MSYSYLIRDFKKILPTAKLAQMVCDRMHVPATATYSSEARHYLVRKKMDLFVVCQRRILYL